MGYESEVSQLAERLAAMLVTPVAVNRAELAMVDAARRAVRQLCRQVLADTRQAGRAEPFDEESADGAVADLQRLLADNPIPYAQIEPEVNELHVEVTTDAGRIWRDIRRRAILATHEWSQTYPDSRPTGSDAWPITKDIAALVAASAEIEQDLVRFHGRAPDSNPANSRSQDALILAESAERVQRLTPTSGASGGKERKPLRSRKHDLALWMRSIADAPAATARLAHLIQSANHLRPETIRRIARAHAHSVLTIAAILDHDDVLTGQRATLPTRLRDHAAILAELAQGAGVLRSIDTDDRRPVAQIRMLREHWRRIEEQGPHRVGRRERHAAMRAMRPSLAVSRALRDIVERHVDNGNWYHARGNGRFPWSPTRPAMQLRIIGAVNRAADDANLIAADIPRMPGRAQVARAPQELLAPQLNRRQQQSSHNRPAGRLL